MAKILIIDDDPLGRRLIAKSLAFGRNTILEADNGAGGLSLCYRERPDLVICDIMMPVMDGAEFVTRIRADQQFATVPIVLVTAVADKPRVMELLKLGVNDYIVKPFEIYSLRTKVIKLLSEGDDAAHRSRVLGRADEQPAPGREARPKILIADNGATVRHLATEALADSYAAVTAEDGAGALAAAAEHKPVLVLIDPDLPVMSGKELLERLRQIEMPRPLKLHLLVGPDDAEVANSELSGLADGVVKKPFDDEELLAHVNRVLDREHYFFYDEGTSVVLKFQPGGVEHIASDCKAFYERVEQEIAVLFDQAAGTLVLDFESLDDADLPALEALRDLFERAKKAHIALDFRMRSQNVRDALRRLDVEMPVEEQAKPD